MHIRHAMLCVGLLLLAGCDYLNAHRADRAGTTTFLYTQEGEVSFSGAFPLELLVRNKAYPATEQDAQIIRESIAPVAIQPVVGPQGQLMYPVVQPQVRCVHILNSVRGWTDHIPPPTWSGPVTHIRTITPWMERTQLFHPAIRAPGSSAARAATMTARDGTMQPTPPGPVDLRELANRIANRTEPTPYLHMQQELGERFTHNLECELTTWTWRLKYGVPVSIEPHAYRKLVRMLIRRQRRAYRAVAGARNIR